MSGFWAVFWLAVIMKIPIAALLWIVWWAIHQQPLPEASDEDGGGSDRDPYPHRPGSPPRPPRRGAHGDPTPAPPKRVRVAHITPRVPAGHR